MPNPKGDVIFDHRHNAAARVEHRGHGKDFRHATRVSRAP
jgi:hypothetical protein